MVRLKLPATVIQIRTPDAARRFQAVLRGEPDPGVTTPTADADADQLADPITFQLVLSTDPEERILEHIRQLFPDHRFAELVDAVLVADGYVTFRSPPGPDAGVDILGGRGPLGFDSPKLCVQVKATEKPVGTPDLDRLAGAMEKHGANRGLFVSWSGFTKPANDDARRKTPPRSSRTRSTISAACAIPNLPSFLRRQESRRSEGIARASITRRRLIARRARSIHGWKVEGAEASKGVGRSHGFLPAQE